ncbi:MAG TPA: D-alanyl-D-alanine carboxypeptidase family protein [Lachnospiraceae bacterium]
MKKSKIIRYVNVFLLTLSLLVNTGQVRAADQAVSTQDTGSLIETKVIKDWPQGPPLTSKTAVLVDVNTGIVLYNQAMHERMYPASTTKIMSALLAIENKSLTDIVTMTETGMRDAYSGSSNILPVLGEQFTMEQCLYMILLKSANDVTTQVAEYVGGSEAEFVNMMNAKAQALGCQGTHFNNANGLPDENHYTTAYDLSLIMQEALKNDIFRQIINTQVYTVPPTNLTPGARTYKNHHEMLLSGSQFCYDGIIGGKTGYTDAAGVTLVTAASRNGRTLISVVMKTGWGEAFLDTISLMDYGFGQFQQVDMASQDKNLTGLVVLPVNKGLSDLKLSDPMANQVDYLFEGYKVGSGSQLEIIDKEKENKEQEVAEEKIKKPSGDKKSILNKFFQKIKALFPKEWSPLYLMGLAIWCLVIVVLFVALIFKIKRKRKSKRRKRRKLK